MEINEGFPDGSFLKFELTFSAYLKITTWFHSLEEEFY
jgi:hypothetical protein